MPSKKTDSDGVDPNVEKFILEHREDIEKLLKRSCHDEGAGDGSSDGDEHHNHVGEGIDYLKGVSDQNRKKVEDTAQTVISTLMDQDFQKHMASAGFEFIMAVDALMKAAPMPDFVREATEKAHETRDNVTKSYCQKNPDCASKKQSKSSVQRIPIGGSEKDSKE